MPADKLRSYFFLIILVGAGLLFFFIIKPFLIPFALAVIFAVLLKPVYQFFLRRLARRRAAAALLTLLLSAIFLLVPTVFLGTQILHEAQQLFTTLVSGSGTALIQGVVTSAAQFVQPYLPGSVHLSLSLSGLFEKYASIVLSWLISNIGPLFSNISNILFSLFIFLIALFYLLRDGEQLKNVLIKLSPLDDADDRKILQHLEIAVNSVVRGNIVLALLQAVLSGIGMAIFGVPNPVLWGVLAGLSTFIPGLGTSLVLVPAAIFLLITGALGSAIGLFLWAALAVGLIDNFLGPRLVGRGARLHPLVVLFSVLGGVIFFGPAGVFLGPLSASLFLVLLALHSESVA